MQKINLNISFLELPKLFIGIFLNGGVGLYQQRLVFNIFISLPVKILNYGIEGGIEIGASFSANNLDSVSRSNYINKVIVIVIFRKTRILWINNYIRGVLGFHYVNIVVNNKIFQNTRLARKKPERNPVILTLTHVQEFNERLPAKLSGRFAGMFEFPTF